MVVDEPNVSRRHAAVVSDSQGFWLMDLGSRNGTFINGNSVGADPQKHTNWGKVELGGMSTHWILWNLRTLSKFPDGWGRESDFGI